MLGSLGGTCSIVMFQVVTDLQAGNLNENAGVKECIQVILFLFFLTGGCSFDEPFASCGYSQSDDDDLNWDQVNTLVKPSSDPWLPTGSFQLKLFLLYIVCFITCSISLYYCL